MEAEAIPEQLSKSGPVEYVTEGEVSYGRGYQDHS